MNTNTNKVDAPKQRKPLPKKRTLANTGNMTAKGGIGGEVVTHGCSQSCPQTSYCTYKC